MVVYKSADQKSETRSLDLISDWPKNALKRINRHLQL